MSAGFTPGPYRASKVGFDADSWASLNSGAEFDVVLAGGDGFAADVLAVVWCDDDSDEHAQASLFAAATDMYEALKAICEHLRDGDDFDAAQVAQHAGFAALAKAHGQ